MPRTVGRMHRRLALLSALACALGAAAVWVVAFHTGTGRAADYRWLQDLERWPWTRPYRLADAIAGLGNTPVFALLALLVVALAALTRGRRGALVIAMVLAVPNVVTQVLKHLLAADRLQIEAPSWPSGHSTATMTLGLCLILAAPAGWRVVAALIGLGFAGAVGLSVVVTGWHYPSDVAGGYLVAGCGASLGAALLPRVSPRDATAVLRTRSLHARG